MSYCKDCIVRARHGYGHGTEFYDNLAAEFHVQHDEIARLKQQLEPSPCGVKVHRRADWVVGASEYAWLIELPTLKSPMWLTTAFPKRGEWTWDRDALVAHRFATKQEAESFATGKGIELGVGEFPIKILEHGFAPIPHCLFCHREQAERAAVVEACCKAVCFLCSKGGYSECPAEVFKHEEHTDVCKQIRASVPVDESALEKMKRRIVDAAVHKVDGWYYANEDKLKDVDCQVLRDAIVALKRGEGGSND